MPDVVNGTASAEPGSAPARARLRRLLRAADGRVAVGWRLLAYLVALLAAQLVAGGAATGLRALGAPRPVHALLFAALYVAATLGLVRVLRRRVDRRPAETLGLGGAGRRLAHALGGAAVALAMLAAVVAIEAAAGWVRVERVALWDGTVAARVIAAAFVMCAVGFCEELVFRGGFLANLAERRSIGFATVVSAVIFGAVHVLSAPPSPAVLVSALTVTALLVAARMSTGALWWAIGWHAAWDFAQHHVFELVEPGADAPATAIVRLVQSGPALWVGAPEFMESGLVVIVVQGAAAALLVLAAARLGRPVRWTGPLDQ